MGYLHVSLTSRLYTKHFENGITEKKGLRSSGLKLHHPFKLSSVRSLDSEKHRILCFYSIGYFRKEWMGNTMSLQKANFR